MELGWDREPSTDPNYQGEKHYRKYYKTELEN